MMLGPTHVDQERRRQRSLSTPVTFSVALGTSSTTIYTAKADELFLIRKFVVSNTTGASVTVSIDIGGNAIVSSEAIAANTAIAEDGFSGLLIDAGADIEGSGDAVGLRVIGWGLRVEGGSDWVL